MPAWPVQIFRWTVRRHTCLTSSGYTGSKSGFWVVEHLFANHMRLGLNRDSFSAWIYIFGRIGVFGQQICGAVLVNLQSPMAKAYG